MEEDRRKRLEIMGFTKVYLYLGECTRRRLYSGYYSISDGGIDWYKVFADDGICARRQLEGRQLKRRMSRLAKEIYQRVRR